MKHLIAFLFIFGFVTAQAQSLDVKADNAYSDNNYQLALELYKQAAESEGVSSVLYYNMGNAYYRLDSISQAIVSYEKALRLDPRNDDARANLKFINEKFNLVQEEKSAPNMFIDNLTSKLHPNGWAVLSLTLFIILLADFALYLFSNKEKIRKVAFFSTGIVFLITVLSCWFTVTSLKKSTEIKYCIIARPSVQLSTIPAVPVNTSQQAYIVPEGYKLEIVDSVSTPLDKTNPVWLEVKVTNDSRAWVSQSDVITIR